jgi:hypothetical protein
VKATARVVTKELIELVSSVRCLGFIFLPLVLLLLGGQLQTTVPDVRVLVGGMPPCTGRAAGAELSCQLKFLVEEVGFTADF